VRFAPSPAAYLDMRVRREWWQGPGRYFLLSAAVVVLLMQHSWTDAWQGDFWIYVATVGELEADPWHPNHPLFGGDGPFAFVSPYTWALGMLARATRLPAFEILVLQGLVNLVLFLPALYAFVSIWLHRPAAAFYALLFVLFLWGPDPWLFSSFFHFRSLAFVLPYPSTLAAALALSSLAAFRWAIERGRRSWVAFVVPVGTFLWIVHPVNGIFLGLGLIACSLESRRPMGHWLTLAAALVAGPALALLWPLFPVGDLWFQETDLVHRGNDAMYDHPLARVAPALAGVPLLFLRLRRNPRDPVATLALALGLLVIIGGLSGASSYGRLLSHAVLMLQVVLADAVATLEARVGERPGGKVACPAFAAAAVALLVGWGWSGAVKPTLEESWRGDPLWLGFLGQHVGRQAVVLTDVDNCWHVPAFGAKVVAFPMPLPFAPDHAARLRAVERFFERDVPTEERREIIRRYRASYLLVPVKPLNERQARVEELRGLGPLVFASPDYELRRVDLLRKR
jgi:hypothetical protein